jgi:hypothetical protein
MRGLSHRGTITGAKLHSEMRCVTRFVRICQVALIGIHTKDTTNDEIKEGNRRSPSVASPPIGSRRRPAINVNRTLARIRMAAADKRGKRRLGNVEMEERERERVTVLTSDSFLLSVFTPFPRWFSSF